MAYKLRPFRDYDEHDVLNLFSYDTTNLSAGSINITKGSLVKIATGWKNYDSGVELGGGIEFMVELVRYNQQTLFLNVMELLLR